MRRTISPADLILNRDGSIYHLCLLPEDIADTILLVGDPGRVSQVSAHFDSVTVKKENREFVTCTGLYRGNPCSVVSTGIGTDNIDIVVNELDALVNVDMEKRMVRPEFRKLELIRLGTSGALNGDIPVGSYILSEIAGGLDNLYHFYSDPAKTELPGLSNAFVEHFSWKKKLSPPYFIRCSGNLRSRLSNEKIVSGITLSSPGFYGPQVRSLRLSSSLEGMMEVLDTFQFEGKRINNFEMECSALYALSSMLGHEAVTLCLAVANRKNKQFLQSYKPEMDRLIQYTLNKLFCDDRA